ncbi:hypothetical protein AB0F17_53885 [Nonomuraea sp. NPDC026600]|uniref:hypothetical protein n=1 Tax=Nonomuraea sp. NPDC026600 TaxID=3155363 RepID=UPI0033FD1BFF
MSIPLSFRGLVDDAAIFPPGLAPLPAAVADHAQHMRSEHANLVGPLVVSAKDLPSVVALVTPSLYPDGLDLSVVVPDPEAIVPVVSHTSVGLLNLMAIEVKLDPKRSLPEQVRVAAEKRPSGVAVYVEAPRPGHAEWPATAQAIARHGARFKFRTGGTEASAFPADLEVATWIQTAVALDVPFKCTAGLHNAIRHTGGSTGFEHHGYLNILLATLRASRGAKLEDLVDVVAQRDPGAIAGEVKAAFPPDLLAARERFVSYGSCSIMEPLGDLADLGLLA